MADISITEPWAKDPTPEEAPNPGAIYGMDVNYAVANAWYAYLPIENILGTKYRNLNLHLTRFSIPQQTMGSMTVSFRGVDKIIPTKVINPSDKTLTLEYIVDEKWQNYRSLYAWMSCINGAINRSAVDEKQGVQPDEYIPLRVYLLDNYKRKILEFVFTDTWISTFESLALEQNDPGEVKHSITITYDKFELLDI